MNTSEIEEQYNKIINIIKDKSLSIEDRWKKINLLEYVESNEIYKAEIDAQIVELQSNQKELIQKKEKLEKLFKSIPLPVIQLDSKLNILKYNAEANSLLEIDKSYSFKKFLPLLLRNETLPQFYKAINVATHETKSKVTLKLFEDINEKIIEFDIVGFPVNDEDGYLVTLIDLTDQIKKSNELQNISKKLYEQEVEKVENYQETIVSMVELIEQRDFYTGGHSYRVAEYAVKIAMKLEFDSSDIFNLRQIGLLHDIGKIGIPDSILLKPGKLTQQEHNIIKSHSQIGYNIISRIPMFKDFSEIILYHHERYDGSGYPYGLKGDDIPLLAQVLSVADTFDAMTTTRIYNSRKTVNEALDELKNESKKSFNPRVIDVALEVFKDIDIELYKTQLPKSDIEKERFAYFFKDPITDLSNQEYLKLLFKMNPIKYKCLNLILIHNLSEYNREFGWEEGNKLLVKVTGLLKEKYPDGELFKFHAVDFVMLHDDHIKFCIEELNDSLRSYKIECELKYFDLNDYESPEELLESLDKRE